MELSVSEGNSGVIMAAGTAPGASSVTITVYQSDGTTEALSISTPVNEDGTYSASIDMSTTGADYVVVAKDEASGESQTANVTVGSSEHITSAETNLSGPADPPSSSGFNWGLAALIAGIVVAVAVVATAAILFFRRRHSRRKTV